MVAAVLNPLPRISLSKLCEYLRAHSARRRRIIEDARAPQPFIVARYSDALDAIARALVAGNGTLPGAIAGLSIQLAGGTKWKQENAQLCIDAIRAFMRIRGTALRFKAGVKVERAPYSAPKLVMSAVQVSIRPDIILRLPNGKVGVVKLYINKAHPLDTEAQKAACALLCDYTSAHLGDVDRKHVYIVDVFNGAVAQANAKGQVRMRKDVEAALEEIAMRWNVA